MKKKANNNKQIIQFQLAVIFIDGNGKRASMRNAFQSMMENVTKIQNFYSNCQQFNTLSAFYLE